MAKKLLIDTDCGTDDAQAIMIALASPSVEVLGITCCYGNTQLENVCQNVLRVLQVCNRLEVISPLNIRKWHTILNNHQLEGPQAVSPL